MSSVFLWEGRKEFYQKGHWFGNTALPKLLKVTPTVYPHLNSRRLPALERFYQESKFSLLKFDPLNLESQNRAENIPVSLSSSPIKIWGKSVQGFLSYDRINKQTNRITT